MDAVDPSWCFVQEADCNGAEWSEAGQDWWASCTRSTKAGELSVDMQPIVRLGEVGRLATPPPYIKYNEEVHMRIHGPAGGEFEGDRDWEWIGRLNHLYPANRVADKVITASASNTNDGNSGSGDVVGAMKEEDARAGARCTCKATWYFEGESFHGCHTEHAVAPWCFGGAGCDLKGMIGSLDNEYELSWMLCQEDGTGFYPHRPPAPYTHEAGIHMRDGAITKFSRKAKVTNAVPTLHKGFAIALAGALCAAAMVVTIWVVLLRKRGDEWEDDGTWNPDKAYNLAREEEVVFDRTNSLGEKMSRYAPGYADPTEPDPSWKGVGGGGVLRTPRKTKMKTYGAVGSDDGSRAVGKWTRTTPTRRSPRSNYPTADEAADSLV